LWFEHKATNVPQRKKGKASCAGKYLALLVLHYPKRNFLRFVKEPYTTDDMIYQSTKHPIVGDMMAIIRPSFHLQKAATNNSCQILMI
jgi:hypothetical protein